MKLRNIVATVVFACLAGAAPASAIETSEVSYAAGDVTAQAYLAMPEGAGEDAEVPGILVVHEWWGHNPYARKRAEMLAEMGYAALAVDMYGDGKTAAHPKEAGQFAMEVKKNAEVSNGRLRDALAYLGARPGVDAEKVAAIGYCFGGSVVLQAGLSGMEGLRAVASFHGSLDGLGYPEDGDGIMARFYVAHGAADPFVKPEHVETFKSEMERLGADLTFVAYEGASHSFTNPEADAMAEKFDMPIGYDQSADEQSWLTLKDFLAGALKGG